MISAIVLAKNEEKQIKECLSGLQWFDEILVVDDNSEDDTIKIARDLGAKVFVHSLENDFAEQRNFGLNKAKGPWVLFVDADERVTSKLAEEIRNNIEKNTLIKGFYFQRKDFFINRWLAYGETGSVRLLRLARKGCGDWQRAVDEVWAIKGETKTLRSPLLHYSHLTLKDFLSSINERSTLNAKMFFQQEKKITLVEWLKPLLKFIQNFIFRFGFLDGIAGFVFAALMSFHSFLVRGKLYLLWKKRK